MLTSAQIAAISTHTLEIFNSLEGEMRGRAAAEVTKLGGASEAAMREAITAASYKASKEIEQSIVDAVTEAARSGLLSDEEIYGAARVAGLIGPYADLASSVMLDNVLRDGIATIVDMTNMVRTSALQSIDAGFMAALDEAMLSVSIGATDTASAVRKAVDSIARTESTVRYSTAAGDIIEQKLYGAVHRAVVTGANQTVSRMQEQRIMEIGAEYVETTAHAGARPEHADWQGQVFKYPDEFIAATGYGDGDGLGGWNCGHSFFPYFPGLMEPLDTSALDDRDNDEDYALSQRQRECERNIRTYQARASAYSGVVGEKAGKDITDWAKSERDRNKALANKWRDEADNVARQRSGARRLDREVGRASEV